MYLVTPDGSQAFNSAALQTITTTEVAANQFAYQMYFAFDSTDIVYTSTKTYATPKDAVNEALGLINELLNTQKLQ